LREALGIAKKDFHELIIDIIKRKRQMTAETVMTKVMDTRMTEDEEEEIGQVFALMCDCVDGQDKGNETLSSQVYEESGEEMEEFMDDAMESEILQMFSCGCVDKIRVESRASKNQQDEEVQASSIHKDIITTESTGEVPSTEGPIMEANVSCCMTHQSWGKSEEEAMTAYTHPFWARATTETRVKLGDMDELVLAFVDQRLI
jgi:hypothetical protein